MSAIVEESEFGGLKNLHNLDLHSFFDAVKDGVELNPETTVKYDILQTIKEFGPDYLDKFKHSPERYEHHNTDELVEKEILTQEDLGDAEHEFKTRKALRAIQGIRKGFLLPSNYRIQDDLKFGINEELFTKEELARANAVGLKKALLIRKGYWENRRQVGFVT